ncbi:hypothetical protein UFOVP53_184 [uncultured Caudovirales phage]|uniref:Uncharacterized protein n=1 Tax=uncultured Caudovirales phage TaxID=2100421 RepID=A0A6J5KXH1_9CAUD|nr:hypothetical protein UFOVP53_184 [uncultured Caudovirales phage]
MQRPTRDPDFTWKQFTSGSAPHDLEFWFYEEIAHDVFQNILFRTSIKNGAIYNSNGNIFIPKIQNGYQKYLRETEREIESILIGDDYV